MVDEKKSKKQTLLDLYPNEGALLKRVYQYLINGNSNQARSLIEEYIQAKKSKRASRDDKRKAQKEPEDVKEKKPVKSKPEITKEIAIQIVTSIEQNYDEGAVKIIEDLRKSDDSAAKKRVAGYDRAMKKLKELKEKFNI